jgi:hypothetical protein
MKIMSLKNILSLLFVFLFSNANWAQVVSHSRTTNAVTLPYSQNFEGSTSEWTLESSTPNKWVVGTATKNGGSKGLYVSNNNGVSNTYSTSQDPIGYSQTYASFQVDLRGISNAELKFDWKSLGNLDLDYGDVWINTGGSDILISYMDPQVNNSEAYGEFTNSSAYANKTIGLFPYVGGVVTIKFRWKCDFRILSSYPGPFAIDNVTVTSIAVPAPTIDWQSLTNVTTTSATIGCNISSVGANPITARGVVYGTSPNPTTANSVITSGSGTGVYYANLTGLSIQTHYYFKGYCTTSAGTFYSSQVEFDTNNISAPVASSASSVGATGFTANWGSESLATGYKIDVATSATIFTNYTPDSNFVTFDFENGEQNYVNTALSNSNNAVTNLNTSNGVYNSANESGNGGQVKKVTGWHNGLDTKYYRVDFNSQTMYNMKLSSKQRSTTNGPKNYKLQYSLGQNGLENWIDISGGTIICADNFTTGVLSDLALPSAMENLAVVSLRWLITSTTAVNGSTLTDAGENNIDDIIIKGSTPQTLVSGYDNLTVSGTSKVVTGLSPLTIYYYRVRSTATGAVSGNSNVVSVTTSYVPCAPTQQPTNLQINGYLNYATGISISFSPVSPAPSGYIVVQYPHGSTPTAPVNETTYSAGTTLGTGKVIYVGTSYSAINITGLTQNTIYDFYVYAYNVTGTCLINYNVTSPLTGSKQTCLTTPSLNAVSSITSSGFTANWSAVSGATSYSISIFSDSNLTQHISGSPFTSNTNLYTATGLTPSATYYFKVKAIGSNSCDSGLSNSSSVTLLCVPISQPFNYQFGSGSTLISFSYQPTTIASTGYLTVVYPNGTSATAPTNGTSYTAGDVLGSGIVGYSGANNYSYIENLSSNTVYDFYTYAFNTSQICTKEYNLVSPLFGSFSTCVAVPTSSSATTITNTGFTSNWSAVTGATNYTLEVFSNSSLTMYAIYPPFTVTTNSQAVTGLSNTGTYYYRVSANGAASCNSGNSLKQGPISLECNPSTSLAATASTTATSINSISGIFTAALSNAPEGYLVVRTTANTQPIPVNGITYTVGSDAIGYIEYVNTTAGSWTSTGLTANATYYYWVFSSITTNCFNAPVYSTTTTSFSEKANATATWTGTVSSSWNTGGNWSTGSLPASTDNIVIDSNASNNTILDTNFTLAAGQKLTLSGTGTLTIDALSRLTIAGIADFGGKSVTIKSTSSGTGTLGQVTGTLTGATKVTVERYIPAKRAWRAITAPLIGGFNSSVHSNWMNGGQSGVSNATGMLVFGPTTSWGIQMAPNYNLLTYNANDSWSGVSMPIASGTLFSSTINNAFMTFITGPFGSSNIASGATATTLKANGQLITGTQTYSNLSSTQYSFIGNPYASPISSSAILTDNANFTNIWVWDPQLGSYGGYVVYSGSAYSNVSGSYTSGQPIQSGQAFFVKPTISSDFIISESHKATVVDNGLFDRNATNPELLRVNLSKQIQTQWQPFDAALVLFDSNSSNNVDAQDAVKMFNSTDNITIQNNGIALMAEHRALPATQDSINLSISETSVDAQYKLSINTEQFVNVGLNATLEDLFTNTSLPITLDGTVAEYQFTTTSDAQSSGNRFRIVFGTVLSNNSSIKSSISVSPNPFNGSNININFDGKPEGNYNYSISNVVGQVLDKGTIKYIGDTSLYALEIKNTLPNGVYILNLTDDQKKEYSVKLIKQ